MYISRKGHPPPPPPSVRGIWHMRWDVAKVGIYFCKVFRAYPPSRNMYKEETSDTYRWVVSTLFKAHTQSLTEHCSTMICVWVIGTFMLVSRYACKETTRVEIRVLNFSRLCYSLVITDTIQLIFSSKYTILVWLLSVSVLLSCMALVKIHCGSNGIWCRGSEQLKQ
jgi:hypothetical protein